MTSVIAQFLVNAGPGSAAGERAERVADKIDGPTEVTYRTRGRGGDIVEMAQRVREADPAVVYAMDLAITPVAAWVLSGRHRPLMVDTGDTPRYFLDLIGASRPARAAADALERIGYGDAARTIVRGPYHAEQLSAQGYSRIEVIPDGVDLSFFSPRGVDDLRSQLGLADTFTVGVQGNFTWYPQLGGGIGWDLVEAMGRRPELDVHAVFIGDGPGIGELRLLADRHGVADRIHVIGRVPYQKLADYLSLCDVTLLTQTNDPSSWARTTGKLPTYLATGRHVIASRVGTAADLLPERNLIDYHGVWDQTYPDRLADRLAELVADRDEAVDHGLALRDLATQFDYDSIAERCAAEVAAVAGGSI